MSLVLTRKEIQSIGYGRYINEHKRIWKTLVLFSACMAGALLLVEVEFTSYWLKITLASIIAIIWFIYYVKVFMGDAPKAGKKFLLEWEKEYGIIEEQKEAKQ